MVNINDLVEQAVAAEESSIRQEVEVALETHRFGAGRFTAKPEIDAKRIRTEAENRVAIRISKMFMGL